MRKISQPKFYSINNDYLFKCIMKDKIIRNYILKICFNQDINIEQCSNVELTKENKNLKAIMTDVKLEDKNNIYLLEMQNKNLGTIIERWLYSLTRELQLELSSGDEYTKIRKVTTFIFENNHEVPGRIYYFMEKIKHVVLTDLIELQIFDIPKELKSLVPERKMISKLFKVNSKEELKKLKLNNEIEEKIREKIILYNANKEEYEKMKVSEESMDFVKRAKYYGRIEGMKEGKKEGRKEGIKKTTLDLAKKMIKEGAKIPFVAKVTGLPEKTLIKMM